VGDNNAVFSGATSELTTVTSSVLEVAADGTLWHSLQRKNVANVEGSLGPEVNELASVHAFSSGHEFRINLVAVSIAELDDSKGSATGGLVDDALDNTLDVSFTFGVVQGTELHLSYTQAGVGLENSTSTLTTTELYATHFDTIGMYKPGFLGD
jgi:hypothetical protein